MLFAFSHVIQDYNIFFFHSTKLIRQELFNKIAVFDSLLFIETFDISHLFSSYLYTDLKDMRRGCHAYQAEWCWREFSRLPCHNHRAKSFMVTVVLYGWYGATQ